MENYWFSEHDWAGMIVIKNRSGEIAAVLTKHALGTPGSGIPVDTHAKIQTIRAEIMTKALNEAGAH